VDGRAGGRTNKNTDMTKLRVAVRNFAIAPEITMRLIAGFNEPLRLCVYAIGQTTPYPYPQTSDCITNDLLYCSVNAMFETSELKKTLFFFFFESANLSAFEQERQAPNTHITSLTTVLSTCYKIFRHFSLPVL